MDLLVNIVLRLAEAIVIIVGGGLLLKSYFSSYFNEKGKNLATKEDIQEITTEIEAVRTDYAKRLQAYKLTSEKEFDILHEVWQKLIDLQRATLSLRPFIDYIVDGKSEEERKNKRLQAFSDSYNALVDVVDKIGLSTQKASTNHYLKS